MSDDTTARIDEPIRDVDHLDELLSEPTTGVIDALSRLDGDLIVLGVAGKMGPTLAWMARRAFDAAGHRDRRVIGVARFTNPDGERWLNDRGETGQQVVDLIEAVCQRLPIVRRLGCHLFMVARKARPPVAPTPPAGVWPGPFSDSASTPPSHVLHDAPA